MKGKAEKPLRLAHGPEDFAVGSAESRAAARALLAARKVEDSEIITSPEFYGNIPALRDGRVHVDPWRYAGKQRVRVVILPTGFKWPPEDPTKVCWDCHCLQDSVRRNP